MRAEQIQVPVRDVELCVTCERHLANGKHGVTWRCEDREGNRSIVCFTFARLQGSGQFDDAVGGADRRPDLRRVARGDLGCDADRSHGAFGLLRVWVLQVDSDEFAL